MFMHNLWSKPVDAQEAYVVQVKADNDSVGRIAWKEWVRTSQSSWKVNTAIDEVLKAHGHGPYQVMAAQGTHKVPAIHTSATNINDYLM